MSPYTLWRQESKDQKIIWKTSRYFSSHLVLIFILQRLISAGSGSGQHHKTSSNPLNSFIRVSTPDHMDMATVCRHCECEFKNLCFCDTGANRGRHLVCCSTQGIMDWEFIHSISRKNCLK